MFGTIIITVAITMLSIMCWALQLTLRKNMKEKENLKKRYHDLRVESEEMLKRYDALYNDYQELKHEAAGVYLAMMKNESLQLIYYAEEEEP